MSRLLLCLFAWGIVACGITRWRMAGIGVGEGLLGLATLVALLQTTPAKALPGAISTWFWLVGLSMLGLLVGTLWAAAWGVWVWEVFLHDALALLFCFVSLSVLLTRLTHDDQRTYFLRQFLRASIALVLLNLLVYGFFQQLLDTDRAWIGRFNGLSANPNQLALYVGFLPFWLPQKPLILSRWQTVLGLVASGWLGWLTGSEALRLAWFAGTVWLTFLMIWKRPWSLNPSQNAHIRAFFSLLFFLGLLGLTSLLTVYAADVYAIGGQGDLRLQRWQHGLTAFVHSPLFGLGPGAFSGDRTPFEGQEAHNLYIDWMASGGLLAVGALIWFQARVWLNLANSRTHSLFAGFIALLVFCSFHYVARHPVFWLFHLLLFLPSSETTFAKERTDFTKASS